MAGGIDWFRWHHGSVTDPKFQLVARKSGASLPDVLAVWAYILEKASASEDRGSFGDIDAEALDCLFNFPSTETRTADILAALEARGMVSAGRVEAWEKRQPKREREEEKSTERVRAFRAKQRHETPGNATELQETPRGEERREEKNKEQAHAVNPPPAARPPEPPTEGHATTPAGLICRAMKAAGLAAVNPGDPRLLALIEQGATTAEFEGLAAEAAGKGKGFAWVLAVLAGRRQEASAIALAPISTTPTETAWQRSQRERVEEATGGLLSRRRTHQTTEFTDADCTPAAAPLSLG